MIATFSLPPAGAKRLIARGIINEPVFQQALTHGRMIISVGTTNSYIAEELGFISADEKPRFAAGIVSGGVPCVTDADTRYANTELGWKATKSLEETLLSAWNWEKKIRGKANS